MPDPRARCAACDATIPARTAEDVYGKSPTGEPFLVIDGPGTGWRSWDDRYWCPMHRDTPDRHARAVAEWQARRDAAMKEWERENPAPVPGGRTR